MQNRLRSSRKMMKFPFLLQQNRRMDTQPVHSHPFAVFQSEIHISCMNTQKLALILSFLPYIQKFEYKVVMLTSQCYT